MFTSTRSSRENSTTDQKIVVEANEGINVGIYDEKGTIKWGSCWGSYIQTSTQQIYF